MRSATDAQLIRVLMVTRTPGANKRMPPESLYGARKMWHYLRRQGFNDVAWCTVERLMSELKMRGMVRSKGVRTTIRGKDTRRAGDLLDRDFTA